MIHEGPLLEYAGPRPRLPAVGGGRPALARARARRAGLPAACRAASWWQLARAAGRARRALRRRSRWPRRWSRRCGSCSCRGCSPSARRRAARDRRPGWCGGVSGGVVWMLVALGLASSSCGAARSRSALVTVQALVLVGIALDERPRATIAAAARSPSARSPSRALFLLVVSRTREPRPVRAGVAPARPRGGVAVALALALTWLVPTIGLGSRNAERAVLALVAFGLVSRRDAPGDALPGAGDRPRRERPRARRARAAAPRSSIGSSSAWRST